MTENGYLRLTVYLKSGEIIHKDVANWTDWGDGLIAFNSAGQPILRVNGDGLEAVEVTAFGKAPALKSEK